MWQPADTDVTEPLTYADDQLDNSRRIQPFFYSQVSLVEVYVSCFGQAFLYLIMLQASSHVNIFCCNYFKFF